tara:strand:+ start:124 stop:375 length:252 start_codon:yes stop_codon:yes gene_type:complete
VQRLSASAAKAKASRDLRYAKSPDRKAKKAHSQREQRKAIKSGQSVKGKDFDHKRGKYVSINSNRGNQGLGTKQEGGRKYNTN